jgi:hypothetical protein
MPATVNTDEAKALKTPSVHETLLIMATMKSHSAVPLPGQ